MTMLGRRRSAVALLWVALALLLLPNVAWFVFSNGKYWELSRPYAAIAGMAPSIIFLTLLFSLFGRHLWLAMVLVIPFLPLVPIETAYIVHYGEPSWYAMIGTAFESNSREVVDYLGPSLWPLVFSCAACLALGIVAAVSLRKTALAWQGRSRALAGVACFATVAISTVFFFTASEHSRAAAPASSAAAGEPASLLGTSWFESSFPLGVPLRFFRWREEQQALEEEIARLHAFRFAAHATREPAERQIYVLVIGEAAREDHWQLFGYDRPTNPELLATSNLIRLPDMVSPWSASRMAVPIIVSRKKGTDRQSFFGERSITRAFSEAGFVTYWMSNQMAFGGYDSPISVVARDADHVSFHNVADYSNPGNYDGVLITPLQEAINSGARKMFIVLHTLGSHLNYALRYPDQYDQFKPSLKGMPHVDFDDVSLSDRILNSYDNSILYSDHFIADVIRTLHDSGAVSTMWYVSDHGEDLISPECKLSGHGSGTVYNFRVPSVFWYSDSYAAEFATELAHFVEHSESPVSTENVFESLIDMAAVDFPGHDHAWSLFSEAWHPHIRIVTPLYGQARVDFDNSGVSKNCHMVTPP